MPDEPNENVEAIEEIAEAVADTAAEIVEEAEERAEVAEEISKVVVEAAIEDEKIRQYSEFENRIESRVSASEERISQWSMEMHNLIQQNQETMLAAVSELKESLLKPSIPEQSNQSPTLENESEEGHPAAENPSEIEPTQDQPMQAEVTINQNAADRKRRIKLL